MPSSSRPIYTLAEALELPPIASDHGGQSGAYRAVMAIRNRIGTRIRKRADLTTLTSGERLFLRIVSLDDEVSNGSFDQYIMNVSGDEAERVRTDLQQIGAYDIQAALDEVATLFAGGTIPCDYDDRTAQLLATDDERVRTVVAEATRKYLVYRQQIYERLADYVRASRAEFAQPDDRSVAGLRLPIGPS